MTPGFLFKGAVVAIWLVAAWFVLTGLRIGVVGYSATPFYDQWSWLFPDELWKSLFAQHNEHRIVVTRLLLLADAWADSAQGIVTTAVMFLFQGAHAVLLYFLTTRAFGVEKPFRRACVALAAAAFGFAGFQFENFTSGFQSQFTGVFLFATAAFAALAMYARTRNLLWLIGAGASATVSAGCMANGVFAPMLLPVLAIVLRLKWRDVILLAFGAAVILVLYLHGYTSPAGHGDPASRLAHLPRALAFFVGYLGGSSPNSIRTVLPLGSSGGRLVQLMGALALVPAGMILLDAWRTRQPGRVAAAGVLLFVLATAGVTALGRAGLEVNGMLSNRYGAASAPFWSVICAWLAATGVAATDWKRWRGVAAVLALALSIAPAQKPFTGAALEFAWRKREAGAALMANANIPATLSQAHPSAEFIVARGVLLRQAGLATFAQPWSRLLGAPAPAAAQNCKGAIFAGASVAAAPAWRVSVRGRLKARAIAFVADGRVIGLGVRHMRDDADPPWPFGSGRAPPIWSGFANLPAPTSLTAVAVDPEGRGVCRVAGVFEAGGAGG